jgi:hypothetical protein
MKKKYSLRILDGTNHGYTKEIICTNFDSYYGAYHFYTLTEINKVKKRTNECFYPIQRTIIENIEECE